MAISRRCVRCDMDLSGVKTANPSVEFCDPCWRKMEEQAGGRKQGDPVLAEGRAPGITFGLHEQSMLNVLTRMVQEQAAAIYDLRMDIRSLRDARAGMSDEIAELRDRLNGNLGER